MWFNFKMPHSTIPCEVYSNSTKTIIHLTKLDPEMEWGDFEWSFCVREKRYGNYVG